MLGTPEAKSSSKDACASMPEGTSLAVVGGGALKGVTEADGERPLGVMARGVLRSRKG